MNRILLAIVAAKFTSNSCAANNYFVCNISLDIFCGAGGGGGGGGGGCSYSEVLPGT